MPHHSDDHPRKSEEEYFALRNAELIKQMRSRLDAERGQRDRQTHFMKCPKCGADLQEKSVGSVMLDACPECHGVWLDQGELDMIQQIRSMEQAESTDNSPGTMSRIMMDILDMFHRTK